MKRTLSIIAVACLIGCASLTPERIAVLTAIATQAAQLGAQEWLAKHPEHRTAFEAVILAINAALRAGDTKQAIELLHSLPTTTLRGAAGEVYVTDGLVVWDGDLKKAVRVTGAAERPVVLAVRDGLRRAVGPTPPPLPVGPVRRLSPYTLELNPGVPTNNAYPPDWQMPSHPSYTVSSNFNVIQHRGSVSLSTSQPTNELTITPLTITNQNVTLFAPLGQTNITRSVLDVQTHAGSVPVVSVRWRQAPGSIYQIQQRESEGATNWWTFASVTNLSGSGQTRWTMPWPPGVQAGLWRVLQIR